MCSTNSLTAGKLVELEDEVVVTEQQLTVTLLQALGSSLDLRPQFLEGRIEDFVARLRCAVELVSRAARRAQG